MPEQRSYPHPYGSDRGGKAKQRWRGAAMKVKDIIRLLEGEGWFLVATRRSHRQYKHLVRPGDA